MFRQKRRNFLAKPKNLTGLLSIYCRRQSRSRPHNVRPISRASPHAESLRPRTILKSTIVRSRLGAKKKKNLEKRTICDAILPRRCQGGICQMLPSRHHCQPVRMAAPFVRRTGAYHRSTLSPFCYDHAGTPNTDKPTPEQSCRRISRPSLLFPAAYGYGLEAILVSGPNKQP
ncbi:hypothetical protein BKA81DRAFT_112336 [Phyllosticta paracitricarpa]